MINAIIGIAKCPQCGKLYAVRIEIQGKKWIATWAFAIDEQVAKREGYTQNEFPPDILYDKNYPGCPYCHKHEDLAKISQPKTKPLKLAVSTRGFDNIGEILKSLKMDFSNFSSCQFNCDVLFLNCGTPDVVDATKLRKWVQNGGCLYASDWTEKVILKAFPGIIDILSRNGRVCKVKARVEDVELREYVGNFIEVEFDLPAWIVLKGSRGTTLLSGAEGQYGGLPIMVKIKQGNGMIFYTSFHNYAQASDKEKALLQLLVLKQMGANGNRSIRDTGKALGVDVDKIKAKFHTNW